MVRILGRKSSINVRKVLWLCEELNLTYQQEDWGNGYQSTQTPSFLQLNPNGLIPVIDDNGFILWESNSIIRYLANSYGKHLYPDIPKARARIDQWIDWQATDLNSAWAYAFMGLVRNSPDHQDPTLITQSINQWNRLMVIVNQQLEQTNHFISSKQFSLADITMGLAINRWYKTPFDHPNLPAVNHYYARLLKDTCLNHFTNVA